MNSVEVPDDSPAVIIEESAMAPGINCFAIEYLKARRATNLRLSE